MFCTLTLIASSLTHFPVLYRSFQVYFHTPPILMVHSSYVKIHHIYELNAHEHHYKVVITSGKLRIFFKPRVSELGACQ